MALPLVVIVGRPNVGKSSLLNALARSRISIVDARAGITRDRITTVIEYDERCFEIVDTGGIGIVDDDALEAHVEHQIRYAVDRADVIVFVVDVRDGRLPLDERVAEQLRPLGKPVILAVNKVDTPKQMEGLGEFAAFGLDEPVAISAMHGVGREQLLERIAALAPIGDGPPGAAEMKLAIVGKRNAGKSTLVNTLAGEGRVIVSEIPGTTRDAVDVRFEREGRVFVAIDTAGVRKKRKMDDIDFYSHTRALHSIRRADVVMHLIDATVPVSEVDLKLASAIREEYKPVLLAINKWDLVRGRATAAAYDEYIDKVMPTAANVPLAIITAETGHNVGAAVDLALSLHEQARTRVPTGRLNAALETILEQRGPSPKRGTRPVKIYYATQVSVAPPTIVFFCNNPDNVTENYRRYMENRLHELLPFREAPIRLWFRSHREAKEGG